jgi:hypothetical protein
MVLSCGACGADTETSCETSFDECNRAHDPEHTLCPLKLAYWCTCKVDIPAYCEAVGEHLVCCRPEI